VCCNIESKKRKNEKNMTAQHIPPRFVPPVKRRPVSQAIAAVIVQWNEKKLWVRAFYFSGLAFLKRGRGVSVKS
jgi:hypothetical protein